MWLLPAFSAVSRVVARSYYHITYAGGPVPATGPVLLVANHPNSLFDPVLVVAAAGRPVRFLAKAPLFTDPKVGFLIRGSGSIPVYRRVDDPALSVRNDEMFAAVHQALETGSAVALFPEGTSHSEPSMVPLKTGAARIALGFAAVTGRAFPILPVGLVFRAKDVFRSRAQIVVGPPIPWDDLVGRPVDDAAAVRELTGRVDVALRQVTVNLEAWEDEPVVSCAVDIWEAAQPAAPDPSERTRRLKVATDLLTAVRREDASDGPSLLDSVRAHASRLDRLGLRPADLSRDTSSSAALRWSLRRWAWLSPPALALGLATAVVFWIPFRVTDWVAHRFRPELDQLSTYKLLVGIPAYGLWIGLLSLLVGWSAGSGWWGLATAVTLPAVGMVGLRVMERWRGAWSDARSFLFLRSRRQLVEELRRRQAELADRIQDLFASASRPDGST